MGKPRRTTTQRGLGHTHQQNRARLPNPNGQPCPICGQLMLPGQPLDADHTIPRALGGHHSPLRWAHARCNRQVGAHLGNALRRRTALTQRNSRIW